MQRAIAFKPPYGTKLVSNKDGSIWLYYDTTLHPVENIVNWLRDVALQHAAESKISDAAMEAHKQKVQAEPKKAKQEEHDWGGEYRISATCKKCGVIANGLESPSCSKVIVKVDTGVVEKLKADLRDIGVDPDKNPQIASQIQQFKNTLPSTVEGQDSKPKEEEK